MMADERANDVAAEWACRDILPASAGPDDDWLRREAIPVLRSCGADPSRLRSADEVFGRIEARYLDDMSRPAAGKPERDL